MPKYSMQIFPILGKLYWRQLNIYFHYSSAVWWRMVRQRSIRLSLGHWNIIDDTFTAIIRHTGDYIQWKFSQYCVSYIVDNWTDILIIPERLCRERYARGHSNIIYYTGTLGDVTFIARNRHTEADIINAIFSQLCVNYIDDNRTNISIIPALSDSEMYARGRSSLIRDTDILSQ